MWPLIIGAVSQATDPAKKLADAYYSHAISLGFTVDYATIYAIYRDEILTDENYSKLLDVFDFRGAKYASGEYFTKVMSMIPPYDILDYDDSFSVDANGLATPTVSGIVASIPFASKYNYEGECYIREVIKVEKPSDLPSNIYLTILRDGISRPVIYTRPLASEFAYFYLYSTSSELNLVGWVNYKILAGTRIYEHIIDGVNREHIGKVDGSEKITIIPEDFIINAAGHSESYASVFYLYNIMPEYWRKYYRP